VNSLDEEQKRATREGLREDELASFDPLRKNGLKRRTSSLRCLFSRLAAGNEWRVWRVA
jgi:hypothetical protein